MNRTCTCGDDQDEHEDGFGSCLVCPDCIAFEEDPEEVE